MSALRQDLVRAVLDELEGRSGLRAVLASCSAETYTDICDSISDVIVETLARYDVRVPE